MGIRLKLFVGLLAITALASGTYGVFDLLDDSIPFRLRITESLYTSIQFFAISHPDYIIFGAEDGQIIYSMNWPLQLARFLAPIVTVTAAISLFSSALEKWVKRLKVHYFYSEHAVVFGFNLRARMICEDLVRQGIKVVLAGPDLEKEDIDWLKKTGVIAFCISGAAPATPAICRVERAKYLFAVHDQDSTNLKVLVTVYQRNKEVFGASDLGDQANKITKINTRCFVHFSEQSYKHLKFGNQFSDLDDYFDLQIFSVYEHSARLLTRSIYMKHAKDILEGRRLRIILFGMDATGQALLEQLVRMGFFGRNGNASISVIDSHASGWEELQARFPALTLQGDFYAKKDANRIQILKEQIGFPKIEFKEMPFDSASLLTGQAIADDSEENEIAIAILCAADATRNLTVADALLQQKRVSFTEIFVRSDETHSEIRQYIRSELQRKNLSGFPTLDEICRLSSLDDGSIEVLAKTIHEEYLKEIEASDGAQSSLESWTKLDEAFKESNRRAASHLEIKCSLIGLLYLDFNDINSLKNTIAIMKEKLTNNSAAGYRETLAECEHGRWCTEKLLEGWTPGTVRNDARKQHPNLVPWDLSNPQVLEAFAEFSALNESDKQKDRNNIEKIPSLLSQLIERLEK